jgi:hypothetical protein
VPHSRNYEQDTAHLSQLLPGLPIHQSITDALDFICLFLFDILSIADIKTFETTRKSLSPNIPILLVVADPNERLLDLGIDSRCIHDPL